LKEKEQKEKEEKKEGEEDDEDEEDSFTMTEVEDIYADQKDDPFLDLIEKKNEAQLQYIQLQTKIRVQGYIDGMTMQYPPTIPRSKTGSNPVKEDESDIYHRRGSQLQVRLKNKEYSDSDENGDEMDSKHGLRSIDIYGASIIDINSGVEPQLS
jgi:hypothetical protein